MFKKIKEKTLKQILQVEVAKSICQDRAVDCGYMALASAIDGDILARNRAFAVMRQLVSCVRKLDDVEETALNRFMQL